MARTIHWSGWLTSNTLRYLEKDGVIKLQQEWYRQGDTFMGTTVETQYEWRNVETVKE